MKVLSLVLLILPAPFCAAGQSLPIKSIEELIDKAEQVRPTDPGHSKMLYEQALRQAEAEKHDQYIARICQALGAYYLRNNVLDSATIRFQQVLTSVLPDDKLAGEAYISLGSVAYYKNQLPLAMERFISALRIYEKLADDTGRSRALNNLGAISEAQLDYQKAFDYYQQSYEIKKLQGDSSGMARSLNNMGSSSIAMKRYKQAVNYLLESVEIKLRLNESRGLASSYANLGIAYKELGQYNKAIMYHRKNMEEDRKSGQLNDLFYGYNNLANVYLRQKKLTDAQQMADSALYYVNRSGNVTNFMEAYNTLYQVSEARGDIQRALFHHKNFIRYKDSVMNLQKNKLIEDLRTAYETERKEQTIRELEQTNRIKDLQAETYRQWRIFLIIFTILLIIVIAVVFSRYRLKQRTSEMLDKQNTELVKLNSFKDRMFAVISHDMRNPVNSFSMVIESLEQNLDYASKEQVKEFLHHTLQSARDLQGLLNNLLEWSLVQIGKLPFNPVAIALHPVTNKSIDHVRTMADSKQIHVINEVPENLRALADASMVTIILRNLLTNAIKFSDHNTTVRICATQSDTQIFLSVTDEGVGMTPEEVSWLFRQEENTRTIGNSSEKGTGIGLLLCKELADRNKGTLSVTSIPGIGSTFTLTLPSA